MSRMATGEYIGAKIPVDQANKVLKRLEEKAWNLGRRREEFAREQEGVKEWRGKSTTRGSSLTSPPPR